MTKKPKLNVKLIRRIQKHITEEPRRFLMIAWFLKAKNQEEWSEKVELFYPDASKSRPPCGTAACIAGTANLLTGGRVFSSMKRAEKMIGFRDTVRDWLEPHPLFQVEGWPQRFQTRYIKALTPKTRAKIACERLDYLINTGL